MYEFGEVARTTGFLEIDMTKQYGCCPGYTTSPSQKRNDPGSCKYSVPQTELSTHQGDMDWTVDWAA